MNTHITVVHVSARQHMPSIYACKKKAFFCNIFGHQNIDRSDQYLVFTNMLVHDSQDTVMSIVNTVFFLHAMNATTHELNPVKEGYTLFAVLMPYEPVPKNSSKRNIMKAGTVLLGARWKLAKDGSVKYLTGATGTSYASKVEDINLCAVPYSVKRLRACMLDYEKRLKIFGKEFVLQTAQLLAHAKLLEPYKAQGVFKTPLTTRMVDADLLKHSECLISDLADFHEFAVKDMVNQEAAPALIEYGIRSLSDALIAPYAKMGAIHNVSTAVRKDTQAKLIKSAGVFLEQTVMPYFPLCREAKLWMEHSKGMLLTKYSIESRMLSLSENTGAAWQARLRAEKEGAIADCITYISIDHNTPHRRPNKIRSDRFMAHALMHSTHPS